jgi:hypothetical protein
VDSHCRGPVPALNRRLDAAVQADIGIHSQTQEDPMKVSRRGVGALAGAGVLAVGVAVATGAGQASAAAQEFVFCNLINDGSFAYAYFPVRGNAETNRVSFNGCTLEQAEPGEPFVVRIQRTLPPQNANITERNEIGGYQLIVNNGPTRVQLTGTIGQPRVEISGDAVRCADLDGNPVDC